MKWLYMKRFYIVNSEIKNSFEELNPFNVEQKVFDYLLKNMQQGNEITVCQVDISNEIDASRQTVSRALKKLEDRNFIVKVGKKHHFFIYLINPNRFWKGDVKFKQACVQKFTKVIKT
jgi:uncharacterized membrane protein